MSETEIISVIIPVYNVEKYLEKCIISVVEQTYNNLEIILVDDGSLDQSGIICDKWSEEDERIRVIHKANGGLSDARNAGLDAAIGTYIGFVDSDDYIHPKMYQRLYDNIRDYGADLAVCGFDWIDEKTGTAYRSSNMFTDCVVDKKEAIKSICYNNAFIVVWNKLYKRELFHDFRFPYGKFAEDLFIMPVLFNKCTRIISVSGNYYYYVRTSYSICRREKTVWHLDEVEASYKMMLFCQDNGYSDLLQDISAMMVNKFIGNMEVIKTILPEEKQRVRDIKKMVRYGILKHGQYVRFSNKLYAVSPALYHFLLKIKKKIVTRSI